MATQSPADQSQHTAASESNVQVPLPTQTKQIRSWYRGASYFSAWLECDLVVRFRSQDPYTREMHVHVFSSG